MIYGFTISARATLTRLYWTGTATMSASWC